MNKVESAEVISSTIADWLNNEVRSSNTEVNGFLDDYTRAIASLEHGPESDANWLIAKHTSHVGNRMPLAWQAYEASLDTEGKPEERDYQSAYLVFTPQMQISGTYRNQCYFEASDAEDYLARRWARPVGIDLGQVVLGRLNKWMPGSDDFREAGIDVVALQRRMEVVSGIGSRAIHEVCARGETGRDLGQKGSPSAQIMKTAQLEWSSLVTDCIVLAAKQRDGELGAVPLLEPKSISLEPKVTYPMAA